MYNLEIYVPSLLRFIHSKLTKWFTSRFTISNSNTSVCKFLAITVDTEAVGVMALDFIKAAIVLALGNESP